MGQQRHHGQQARNQHRYTHRGVAAEAPPLSRRRPLPPGYDIASWSAAGAPLVRDRRTGVIIWPIRYNLVPLYDSVEGTALGGDAGLARPASQCLGA